MLNSPVLTLKMTPGPDVILNYADAARALGLVLKATEASGSRTS